MFPVDSGSCYREALDVSGFANLLHRGDCSRPRPVHILAPGIPLLSSVASGGETEERLNRL
jgi:hypothetical protein